MTTEIYLSYFGGLFLWQLPTFVIGCWGLWVGVSRRDRLGRVAARAIPGFGLLIAYALVSSLLRTMLLGIQTSQRMQDGSEAATSIATINLWGFATYPLYIVGLALVARAVFLDREMQWQQKSIPKVLIRDRISQH